MYSCYIEMWIETSIMCEAEKRLRWVCECGCVQFSHMFNNLCKIHWKIVAKTKIEARKRPIKCHGVRKNINTARRRRLRGFRSEMLGVLTRKRISKFFKAKSLSNGVTNSVAQMLWFFWHIPFVACMWVRLCSTQKLARSGFIVPTKWSCAMINAMESEKWWEKSARQMKMNSNIEAY